MGAALLQHIHATNQLSELEHNQRLVTKIRTINNYLDAVLPVNHHLVMFLAGSGGTGKSRVIQCSKDFARRWHSVASTVICASSGVAAMLIGGCTLHSALGIGIRREPPKPTQQQIDAWSEVGVLFVDEFSMITPHMLDLMDTRLRQLKGQPDKLYGGVHIIFCGDFYQLPPVGSGTVYSNPISTAGPNTIRASNGRHTWKTCLTDVAELTQNHRQQDPKWASALEHFRINQPRQEDIDSVSSRYMFDPLHPIPSPPKFTMTAVPFKRHARKSSTLLRATTPSKTSRLQKPRGLAIPRHPPSQSHRQTLQKIKPHDGNPNRCHPQSRLQKTRPIRQLILHRRRTIHRHQQRRRFQRSSQRNASLPSRRCLETWMHHRSTRIEIREKGACCLCH